MLNFKTLWNPPQKNDENEKKILPSETEQLTYANQLVSLSGFGPGSMDSIAFNFSGSKISQMKLLIETSLPSPLYLLPK